MPLAPDVKHVRVDAAGDPDLDADVDPRERVERAEGAAADLPHAFGATRAKEPRRWRLDVVRERVEVRGERCGRGRVDARDVVIRAELRCIVSFAWCPQSAGDTHILLSSSPGRLDDVAQVGRPQLTERRCHQCQPGAPA